MRRALYSLLALAAVAAAAWTFWYLNFRTDDTYSYQTYEKYPIWLALGLPFVCLLAAVVFVAMALDNNIYLIKSGTVVGHGFSPAHMTPTTYVPEVPGTADTPGTSGLIVPGQWLPDEWSICLQDERGHTGWISFSSNVFDRYPVGSYYQES
jgi:hypothetical protein